MLSKRSFIVPWLVLASSCNLVSQGDSASTSPSMLPPPPPVFAIAPTAAAAIPAVIGATALNDGDGSSQAVLGDYSQDGLGTLPDNCIDPAVVMMAVPKDYYAKDTFDWRHVRQVALANPEFRIVRNVTNTTPGQSVSFTENEHKPTKGVALVAHCVTSKTCLRFAAAYKAVVATASLTPICGSNPNIGARITGGKSVLPASGDIQSVLPDKKDVQSQCIRLAACRAARDHRLANDETQACMRKPNDFKTACALRKTCEQVLACSQS